MNTISWGKYYFTVYIIQIGILLSWIILHPSMNTCTEWQNDKSLSSQTQSTHKTHTHKHTKTKWWCFYTSSKSSLAEGRSVAKLESPRCFSILSPCTTVVLTTLLTLRPSTGSAWNCEVLDKMLGSDKVTWWMKGTWYTVSDCQNATMMHFSMIIHKHTHTHTYICTLQWYKLKIVFGQRGVVRKNLQSMVNVYVMTTATQQQINHLNGHVNENWSGSFEAEKLKSQCNADIASCGWTLFSQV